MTSSNKKPILSFDLDGTLMKPGFGDKVWLEGLPRIYADTHHLDLSKAKEELLNAYDTLGNTRREWYDLSYWIQKLNLDVTPNELLDKFSSYIQPYQEVPALIKKLSKTHMLIISSAAMKPFITIELQTAKLSSYFSNFFSATSDTKTVKKDPYFYQMITKKLNCKPKEIIHVGDNFEFDYVSPKKAGLYAVYLNRSNKTKEKQDQSITSLNELEDHIKKYLFE